MKTQTRLAALAALVALTVSCASTQIARTQQVSVTVHTTLAAVDEAESLLYRSAAVPLWTAEKHRAFSAQLVIALKAGRALNEGARSIPVSTGAKADLATVSNAVNTMTEIVKQTLPPNSPVVVALTAAKDSVLALLPLFLEAHS